MTLTDEQLTFLAALADKGIAEQAEIAKRNADIQTQMEAQAARDAFVAGLVAQKQQEVEVAVQDYDTKQNVPAKVATPVILDVPPTT